MYLHKLFETTAQKIIMWFSQYYNLAVDNCGEILFLTFDNANVLVIPTDIKIPAQGDHEWQ
jgi:hypothetical protein